MPSYPPLPSLLEPYLAATATAPPHSLTLVTSTLSTSTTWLLLRFVLAAVNRGESQRDRYRTQDEGHASPQGLQPRQKVVLVSWLREEKWWRDAGKKLGIPAHSLTVVDFLTGIPPSFTSSPSSAPPPSVKPSENEPLKHAHTIISTAIKPTKPSDEKQPILLILDGLDFLLAATGCSVREMLETVMGWREEVHSTLITLHADAPLLHGQTNAQLMPSLLETAHASLTLSIAHTARMVMSTRALETGAAKDVSGVLRICRGGADEGSNDDDDDDHWAENGERVVEGEYLYFVAMDGGVRVFERGA